MKLYKLDQPEGNCLIGIISSASRPFESERAIVLERSSELEASYNSFKYEVASSYVDLKSGIVVAELDLSKPTTNNENEAEPI